MPWSDHTSCNLCTSRTSTACNGRTFIPRGVERSGRIEVLLRDVARVSRPLVDHQRTGESLLKRQLARQESRGGIAGDCPCSVLDMGKNTTNQKRGRKYGGSSSFADIGQPSRAPRQDEEDQETIGSAHREFGPAYDSSPQQGISNRPAKDEHAFPDADESISQDVPDSVDEGPKQVGGNRGRV